MRDKTPPQHNYIAKWDFTKATDPLVDEIAGLTAELRGYESTASIDSSGIHITRQKHFFALGNQQIILMGKTIEIDISEFDFQGDNSKDTLVLSYDKFFSGPGEYPCYLFNYRPEYGWNMYSWKQASVNNDYGKQRVLINDSLPLNSIDGKTIKCVFNNDGTNDFYLNDVLIGSTSNCWANNANTSYDNTYIKIGSANKSSAGTDGNSHKMTVTGVRIYANEE